MARSSSMELRPPALKTLVALAQGYGNRASQSFPGLPGDRLGEPMGFRVLILRLIASLPLGTIVSRSLPYPFINVILEYNCEGDLHAHDQSAQSRRLGHAAVPPALLDILHLQPGAKVGIAVESGRLIVEPQQRRRYTLDELLAQCNPKARRTKEEREWLDSKPVGGELI